MKAPIVLITVISIFALCFVKNIHASEDQTSIQEACDSCEILKEGVPPTEAVFNEESLEDSKLFENKVFSKFPLLFIKNQGQLDDEVAYYVKGSDKTLYFTSRGITIALVGDEKKEGKQRWAVRLEFLNANPSVKPIGEQKQNAVFSYFKGKPEEWKTGVPTYSRLVYRDLWPGIDLVYSCNINQLKHEFIVQPGADPQQIRLAYHGASNVRIQKTGKLQVITPVRSFEDDKPFAYQESRGDRSEVSIRYELDRGTEEGAHSYAFELGPYNQKQPLVIDPAWLVYCGYIGGNDGDSISDITVDKDGNAYVTGMTWSDEDQYFPVKTGPDLTYNDDPSGGVKSFL